jgi:plastocyanin
MRIGTMASLIALLLWPPAAPVVHEIRMTSRFLPAVTTANPGDTLRFINQSGGPHNIQFFADSIPEEARTLLAAAMPGEKLDQLSSPLLVLDQATYDIAVPALPPGRYPFVCLPHAGSRMLGSLVIP